MSELTDIADALVDELNGQVEGFWPITFTAVREYSPDFDLEDMAALHVTVVPRTEASRKVSRGHVQYDYVVDITPQLKTPTNSKEEHDQMMAFVEEIKDHLLQPSKKRLDGYPAAVCLSVANDPVYAPEHMREKAGLFTSVLACTYRVIR